MSGIKRDSADKYFSDCIRERAGWCCENCSREFPEGSGRQQLHCSHFFGRANKRLRWEPLNAFSLCAGCHRKMGENPGDHYSFVFEKLGEQTYDILLEIRQNLFRTTKELRKEIGAHYRREYEKMAEKRAEGVAGRIEFTGFL